MILVVFISLSAVCASDINETDNTISTTDDDSLSVENDDSLEAKKLIETSVELPKGSVHIKDSKYVIQLLDGNGTGLAKKKIQISFNNKNYTKSTNSNGKVYFKLSSKGVHTLSYMFNEKGYVPVSGSKKLSVVNNNVSKIKGSSYVAYVGAKNPYTVTLTTGGVDLPYKQVIFKINGKTYTKKTNSLGKATFDINLKKGTYKIYYSFKGTTNAKAAKGSSKITVKKGMPTNIYRLNNIAYKEKVSAPLKLKYVDARGKPIHKKTIVLTLNGKEHTKVTDENGTVTFYINKNKGLYKAKVNSYNTDVYIRCEKTYSLIVKPDYTVNAGFWVFGADMKKINLNTMLKNGINQIFLNSHAVTLYGRDEVAKFATDAKSLGIKVHIWMQAFYKGGWISPVYSSGKYKYSLFNSIIDEAKDFAAIDGVAGIHFDYLRFPGTAYKHSTGVDAINYFTKKACEELHAYDSNLIISAAVMPEPSGMKYYYGQDIPTISKYLDVIVPMIYKGNYGKSATWIKSTTESFVKMSNGAEVWTGLQGYYSDDYVKSIPVSALSNDVDHASMGGARGVIIFRYTLFNMMDFTAV